MTSKNYRIPLFCTFTSLFWFSLYTYVPTLAIYSKSLGANYKMVGIIIGSYGFVQMLLRIPLGISSDTVNRRKIFIIFGSVMALGSGLGLWLFADTNMVLIFRGMAGAAAAAWVTFTVLFSSYFDNAKAPEAVGIIGSFSSLGQVVAIFIGGIAAQQLGQQAPFMLAAVGALIALIMSFGIVEKQTYDRQPLKITQILLTAKDRDLLLFSVLAVLIQFVSFATVFGFTPVAAKQLGANSFQLGLLGTFSTAPGIAASYLGASVFAKRFGERNTLVTGFFIAALACIIIPFVKDINLLFITQAVGGFSTGFVFPLLMGLCIKKVENNKRATAMGFFQAVYGIGMFMGPVIVGFLSDMAGLTWGFWVTGTIGILGAVIALLL